MAIYRKLQLLLAAQVVFANQDTTILPTSPLPLNSPAPSPPSHLLIPPPLSPDAFLTAPPLARDRTTTDILSLCKSPDFLPTISNWHESCAPDFLRSFPVPSSGRGVIDEIAFQYLGRDVRCGVTGGMCRIDCASVVAVVDDVDIARQVWFVLAAARNLAAVFESVDQNLITAQSNVGLWAPKIAHTFFWAGKNHYELQREALVNFFNTFVLTFFTTAIDLVSYNNLLGYAEHAEESLLGRVAATKALRDAAPNAQEQARLAQKVSTLESRWRAATSRAQKLRTVAQKSEPFTNRKVYTHGLLPLSGFALGQTGGPFVASEKDENSASQNTVELQIQIQSIASQFRSVLKQSKERIFAGGEALSSLLEAGSFLETQGALEFWASASAEDALTRAITLHSIAAAWRSQPMWITCTTRFEAPDARRNSFSSARAGVGGGCEADRSGPQDMKACVDGRACYLYRWNSRGFAHAHAVERPFGWQAAKEMPWRFSIRDVVVSSVRSYRGEEPQLRGFEDLWDPAAPGLWNIPVCMSEYNWNGPVEPVSSIRCDIDPRCKKKALPCYCGPLGRDTRALWEKTGLWFAGAAEREYRKMLCPRRIKERVRDPIERYVALCRLDVRKQGLWQVKGAHSMCGAVIEALESMGVRSVGDVEGRERSRLLCLSGLAKDKSMCRALGV